MNPSFEKYSFCPWYYNQIQFAYYWSPIDSTGNPDTPWHEPLCAPELIASCSDSNISSTNTTPLNSNFYHYPRTGKSMAQMVVYDNLFMDSAYLGSAYYQRDYMQGRLSRSLLVGITYCVTFYVALENISGYAVNHFGAYLDNGSIDVGFRDTTCFSIHSGLYDTCCAQPHTTYAPQIVMDSILLDTLGWSTFDTLVFEHRWTKVQGSFVANGSEKFITFGNYFDFENTDTIQLLPFPHYITPFPIYPLTLYLIDDISVVRSDAVADAGPDQNTSPGIPVYIGNDTAAFGGGDGMPCWWYKVSGGVVSATAFDSGGRILVSPDSTTTYVEMMNICGHITYDTVTVNVWPLGITSPSSLKMGNLAVEVSVYPNPASELLHFQFPATGSVSIRLMDIVGRFIDEQVVSNANHTIFDVHTYPKGVNIYQVILPGSVVTGKVVIE